MKMITNVEGEGLESLLGQRVTLYCGVYIYTGDLVGVNDRCVKLSNAGIVYETGPYFDKDGKFVKDWLDYQKLPNDWYVSTQAIESIGILK